MIALIIDRRALVAALGALGECKATRPACEEEEGEEAEGEKDGAEDEAVKSLDWTALIERKSVTAVLWAIRAFVRRVI